MTLQIVCQNCGAKYKLPPTFTADKAKCKACGSAIDVAAQRESDASTAAAAPAAAKPAAARPARARGGDQEASPRRPRGSGSGSRRARGGEDADDGGNARGGRRSGARGGARRGRGGDDDAGDDKPRRGRAAAEKKAGNPALLWGGIGIAAIAIVGLIFLFGGDDEPAPEADGVANASAGPEAADGGAKPGDSADTAGESADSGDAPTGGGDGAVADGGSDTGSGDGGTAGGDSGAGAAAATDPDPEEKPAESAPKPAAKTDQPKSPDEVFDPKTETQPVRWPDDVSAEERQQAEADVALIVEEGTGWRIDKAKTRLLGSPYPTVLAITEALRHFDYFDADQSRTAYSLHELLRQIHDDKLNPGYRVPEAGVAREDMNIENVEFNAKCVKPWVRLIESKYTSREAFTAYIAQLKKQKKDD